MEKNADNQNKKFGSSFASIPGMVFLAVLLLIAAYFKISAAIAFIAALLLLSAVSFFWGKASLSSVEIETRAVSVSAFPGGELSCRHTLSNNKLLPLVSLVIITPSPDNGCVEACEDKGLGEIADGFSWIMGYQTLSWQQKLKAVHRGVCDVKSLELISGDGFGLAVSKKKLELSEPYRFVVYPRVIPVNPGPIIRYMREMERTRNGIYTDPTLISSTRPYRDGDSFRNVNWRSLARGGEMTVNVFEKLGMHRVCFVVDLPAFTHIIEVKKERYIEKAPAVMKEKLEEVFSLMASLALELEKRDVLCSLVVPDYGNGVRVIIPDRTEGESVSLLTAMAEVSYDAQDVKLPFEILEQNRHLLGQIYVFSSPEERQWEREAEALSISCIKVADFGAGLASARSISEGELKT